MLKRLLFSIALVLLTSSIALAYNPLITDDANTIGEGCYLIDVFRSYSIINNKIELTPSIEYGVVDRLDVIVELPTDMNQRWGTDIALKLLLYKNDYFAFSVRPLAGIMMFEFGSFDYNLNFSGSVNLGALIFYENLEYDFSYSSIFISSAAEYIVSNGLAVTINIGTKKLIGGNLFAIGGLMYSLTDKIDIDLGVKYEFMGNNLSSLLGFEIRL
jgi:hypothetical protein